MLQRSVKVNIHYQLRVVKVVREFKKGAMKKAVMSLQVSKKGVKINIPRYNFFFFFQFTGRYFCQYC